MRNTNQTNRNGASTIRCAIYTRKSSEEGLEQDFNSLDAQRESCEAFILSQKHERWIALPAMYDDGGISGGTMERPALKRMLADIEARNIDAVVVYKVDRLTRTLGDFAKIVEVFDKRGVSFVSVTQQFNTTTSMGRLTLNMLLSFAQFEREVTSERIRDKIAASKKKGMWMGGLPPLGYDVKDRKLVVNGPEAETVRDIYRRYIELRSVRALKHALDQDRIVSKRRVDRYGRATGGKSFSSGALYLMLQNRVYRGEIVHKDKSYPGKHRPIIDRALWDVVQGTLATNRIERETGRFAAASSLLAGLIYDETGERMSPNHASKKGRRYRYYVTRALLTGTRRSSPNGRRLPAGDVEQLVEARITAFLANEAEVFNAIGSMIDDVNQRQIVFDQTVDLAKRWPGLQPAEKYRLMRSLIDRVDVTHDALKVHVRVDRLAVVIAVDGEPAQIAQAMEEARRIMTLTISATLRRVGKETKLVIESAGREPDRSMLRLLAQAHRFREMVMRGSGETISALALEAGVDRSYFTRVLRLSFLAPKIAGAILRGSQPADMNAKRLVLRTKLALKWDDQIAILGIR